MKVKRQACLVCRTDCSSSSLVNSCSSGGGRPDFRETFNFGGSIGSSVLNKQLWNVFITRKLLGIPQHICQNILRLSNGRRNPSSWFVICGECGVTLEEAWNLHQEIVKLEGELRRVGQRLQEQIKEKRRSLKKKEDKEGGAEDEVVDDGSSVERQIWKWLLKNSGQSSSNFPFDSVVKREISSPVRDDLDKDDDNGDWGDFDKSVDDEKAGDERPVRRVRKAIVPEVVGGGVSDSPSHCDSTSDDDQEEKEEFVPVKKRRGRPPKIKRSNDEGGGGDRDLTEKKRDRKRKIKCSKCPATYRNNAELASHLRIHKKCDEILGNAFDCKECKYPCLTDLALKFHNASKHQAHDKHYICNLCGYEAAGKKRLERHMQTHSSMLEDGSHQCNVVSCKEKFTSYDDFKRHQSQDHGKEFSDKLHRCDKCPSAYFTSKKMLQDHISLVHEAPAPLTADDNPPFPPPVEIEMDGPPPEVKCEIHSPERDGDDWLDDDNNSNFDQNSELDSSQKSLDEISVSDGVKTRLRRKASSSFVVKKEELEEEDDDDTLPSKDGYDDDDDGGNISNLSFSEDDEDIWKPKKRGRKKRKVTWSRSKDSVRKAKSSLRSKKYDEVITPQAKRKYVKRHRVSCPKCSTNYRNDAELAKHMELHKKTDAMGNEFDCKMCNYPCESERTLRQHKSLKHELQKYICDYCGYEAPGKKRLERHKKQHKNLVDGKTYKCDICEKKFDNYLTFTRHQRMEHAEELNIELFRCDQCTGVYTSNKMLLDHILHVHEGNSKYCCDICGKGFVSSHNLREHMITHEEQRERSEICWVCGIDFLTKKTLQGHVRKFHPTEHSIKPGQPELQPLPEKEFKCLYCDFTSPFRVVVMRHRKTHKDVYRHLCEICSNEYSTLHNLAMHKRIAHGGEKCIVKCDWCGKSFAHNHYLRNHLPRCKMRPPDAEIKKKRKPFRDTLLVRPEGEQDEEEEAPPLAPPPPPEEPAVVVKPENLTLTTDNLEKDPKHILCKYCKKYTTDNRGKMYDHVMKIHKDELEFKYSCDICNVKYTMKTSLNRHMAVHHTTDNMIACIYCQKVFRHWSLLRLHYKNNCKSKPPDDPIPEQPESSKPPPRTRKPRAKQISKPRGPRKPRLPRGDVASSSSSITGGGGTRGGGATGRRGRRPQRLDQIFYPHQQPPALGLGGGHNDSMEAMEGALGNAGSHFLAQQHQQPPTESPSSSSSSPFPLAYHPPPVRQQNIGGMGMNIHGGSGGGGEGGPGGTSNMSVATAEAMQLLARYSNQQGSQGGGGASGGHRGWW